MSSTPKTRTPFSSYKSPRPAPSAPMSAPSSSTGPMLRRMVSEPFVNRTKPWRRKDELSYDYFAFRHSNFCVRQGYVGIQRDKLRSWSWTRRLWLLLDNTRLRFFPKKNAEPSETLVLHQVRHVERVDIKPYCLMLATASKTWYLIFKDSITLYDWFYDIRIRCPLLRIGPPTDFRHDLHVTYDHAAKEITGLPEAWIETLSSWGISPDFGHGGTTDETPPSRSSEMTPSASEPASSPRRSEHHDEGIRPLPPIPMQELRRTSRLRSASDATATRRAASAVPSVEQFRRSPNRYREVEARDLTGAVKAVHLLPTTRHENCDIWKAEWTGAFGTRRVAIQVVRLFEAVSEEDTEKLSGIVHREVKALHQLRHPNVVRIRGFCRDQGPLPALVSSWLSGNIIEYLRNKQPAPEKSLKMKLLTEVAAGLNYLHNFSRTIVHGELRGSTILITDNGNACISGFGLNPVMQELAGDPRVPSPFSVSPRWAAIEVILMGRRHISHWSDVFSFGRTVVEVMTGKDPYHYLRSDVEVASAVMRGVPPRRPPVFGDDGLWHFLERCWKDVPTQRPSMALALLRMEDIFRMHYDDQEIPGDKQQASSAPPSARFSTQNPKQNALAS